jgi:hypothetical protein
MEAIGDITATCDVSRLQVDGNLFDSRIQGGVLADGLAGVLAGLCTITPVSVFGMFPFPYKRSLRASSLRLRCQKWEICTDS